MNVSKQEIESVLAEVEKVIGKAASHASLKRLWQHVTQRKKLSPEALDRIALLLGFQSWKDFDEAIHGVDDGQTNYDIDRK